MILRFDPIGSTNCSRGWEPIAATQPPDQTVPTGAVLVHLAAPQVRWIRV